MLAFIVVYLHRKFTDIGSVIFSGELLAFFSL